MTWDTDIYEIFEGINIDTWADFAGQSVDPSTGYVVWRYVDDQVFNYLDVGGYFNAVVSFDFRADKRATVQRIMRDAINALWRYGLLITVNKCEWVYYDGEVRGTLVTAVLRTETPAPRIDGVLIPLNEDAFCGDYYGDDVVWDTELVKSFNRAKVQAWPDFAPQDSDIDQGHVVWRQSDELVTDYLDTPSTSQIEVELDFRACTRAQVQAIMSRVINLLERTGQLISAESAQWYFEEDATIRPIRGSVITALLQPNPSIQPVGEFSSAFSPAFDVLQGET